MPKIIVTEQQITDYIQHSRDIETGVYASLVSSGLMPGLSFIVLYAGTEKIELERLGKFTSDTKESFTLAAHEIVSLKVRTGLLHFIVKLSYEGQEPIKIRVAKFVVGHPGHRDRLRKLIKILRGLQAK